MDVFRVAMKRGHGWVAVLVLAMAAFFIAPGSGSAEDAVSPEATPSIAPDQNNQPTTPDAAVSQASPAGGALASVGADACLACH